MPKPSMTDDRFGLETASKLANVSLSETAQHAVLLYVELLRKWQKVQNLVGPETLSEVWARHIADSLQLVTLISDLDTERETRPLSVVDLGSGGGLPGAVLAIAGKDLDRRFAVTMVEANSRKTSFLRTVSRETNTPFSVVNARIENAPVEQLDVVTARALAPLDKLIGLSSPWLDQGATAFFHKGGESERELSEWSDAESYDVVKIASVIDPMSCVLRIRKKS